MPDNLLGKKINYSAGYDPDVLFPISRSINREKSGLCSDNFSGYDIWNCYEFSYLDKLGKPVVYRLRLVYSSDSPNIVESKSLKLYLNGFSIIKFNDNNTVLSTIKKDLGKVLVTDKLHLEVFDCNEKIRYDRLLSDDIIDDIEVQIKDYDLNPELLQIENAKKKKRKCFSNLLKTNCPVTGQPDWASVYIEYESNLKIKKVSLLKYIVSFRNHQDYHENCCEKIFHDISGVCKPDYLVVKCFFTRRGGIEINPIRFYGIRPESDFEHHLWRQ
jgi:7-cyano-7-deazaguanine reductase